MPRSNRSLRPGLSVPALAGLALAAGAFAVPCTIEPAPAATLLVPYFSLDIGACGSPQAGTFFTVINSSSEAVLTHVTLWTNLGVAVDGFDLYLQGYDLQTIDLNAWVCDGVVPITGQTTSPAGEYSSTPVAFPDCGDPLAQARSPQEVASLQAYLNGEQSPSTGMCAAEPTGGRAEGYVTVDVTAACTTSTPNESSYQSSILGFNNVLVGEYRVVDPLNNFAEGFEAVHVEAFAETFGAGDVTFYGRYNAATAIDAREPLATTFQAPYELSVATFAATAITVWRETDADGAPFACGNPPGGFPLPTAALVAFADRDDQELGGLPLHGGFELATQRRSLDGFELRPHPQTAETGWLFLNLQHPVGVYSPALRTGQAWVSSTRSSAGRFATGLHAAQLDSACAPASLEFTTPGRTAADPN